MLESTAIRHQDRKSELLNNLILSKPTKMHKSIMAQKQLEVG